MTDVMRRGLCMLRGSCR